MLTEQGNSFREKIHLKEVLVRKTFAALIFVALLLGLTPSAQCAGFLIYEHGAAAMAMAGAFVSVANDPSAIFHNPAGIAWLKGTRIAFGPTLILPQGSLELPNWIVPSERFYKQESQFFYPTNFYITHQLNERVTAGFGFFSPYGLGTKWPKEYPLRYIATSDDMKTFFFNPTLAIKLTPQFAIGLGFSYIHSTLSFELVRLFPPVLNLWDVPVSIKADGNQVGFNAGALYKGEKFSLGFNWRGGFEMKYKGDLKLNSYNIPPPFNLLVPAKGEASTSFHFPHILGFGGSFRVNEKLLLSADVHYVLWSSYDQYEVRIDYPDPTADPEPEIIEEAWKDAFTFRSGFQYEVNPSFALRAGLLYDQTPQPLETMDPILPDANRWALTLGFGFKRGAFILDLAYQYEIFDERKSPNRNIYYNLKLNKNFGEGTYKTKAHLLGISLGFVF